MSGDMQNLSASGTAAAVPAEARDGRRTSAGSARSVITLIAATALVRIALAASTGLGPDESYMVGNARALSLSYVDHPPLHVWIVGVLSHLFGTESGLLLRLPFIAMFAAATWLSFLLAARLYGERAGLFSALILNLIPVFTVPDASWILPDGPLIFLILAAACTVAGILFSDSAEEHPLARWLLAGALVGLALLAKYFAAFFFLSVFATLLTVPFFRRFLATPGPWLGALVAVLLFLPVIIWNLDHGMAGLRFQGHRLAGVTHLRPDLFAASIGGQAAYLAPWFLVLLSISLARALRRGPRAAKDWYLALAAVGPIVTFTALTLFAPGLPHWPMPGWLFAIPLLGRDAAALFERRPRLVRGYGFAAAGLMALAVVAFGLQASGRGVTQVDLPSRVPDPTVDLVDWTDLRTALEARGLLVPETVVAGQSWVWAGKASYALGPGTPVLCLCRDPQHFAFRQDQESFAGRDVVLVVRSRPNAAARSSGYFGSLMPLGTVPITRAGEDVLKLDLFLGRDLRFPPEAGR